MALRGFREAVQDSNLIELVLEGYQFTWSKSVGTPEVKEGKLDRAFATQQWLDLFPHNKLVNGVSDKSDHNPLWLRLNKLERRFRQRGFRFENAWLEESELPSIVGDSWNLGMGRDFMSRMKLCTDAVDEWGKRLRSRYRDEIKMCRRTIDELRMLNGTTSDQLLVEAKRRLSVLLLKRKPSGDRDQKCIGYGMVMQIPSFSMPWLVHGEGVIISLSLWVRTVGR